MASSSSDKKYSSDVISIFFRKAFKGKQSLESAKSFEARIAHEPLKSPSSSWINKLTILKSFLFAKPINASPLISEISSVSL